MSAIEAISTSSIRQTTPYSHWMGRLTAVVSGWFLVARTRRQLADLSDDALADIGLTREAALGEAMRPFWDHHRFDA